MAIIRQPFLFSWSSVDTQSDLDRLDLVLISIPDEDIINELIRRRGNRRNDFPIEPMWNALLAGVVFQHRSAASLLRELKRNGELRFPGHVILWESTPLYAKLPQRKSLFSTSFLQGVDFLHPGIYTPPKSKFLSVICQAFLEILMRN